MHLFLQKSLWVIIKNSKKNRSKQFSNTKTQKISQRSKNYQDQNILHYTLKHQSPGPNQSNEKLLVTCKVYKSPLTCKVLNFCIWIVRLNVANNILKYEVQQIKVWLPESGFNGYINASLVNFEVYLKVPVS